MLELCIYMLGFIALSGLMALIEAALLSVSRGEISELLLQKAVGSVALKQVSQKMTQALAVIVILTNTINVLGPILAGSKAIELYGEIAIGVVTALLTLGTIVFSEIVPKSLGAHYAPHVARLAAPAIRLLMYTLFPVVFCLEAVANLFKAGQRRLGTEVQIRSLVTMGRRAGHIEQDEGHLIRRAFILNDRTAADVMTPLADVVSVQDSAAIQDAASDVFRHAFSRYPIFGATVNDVRGLALSRDILQAVTEGKAQETIASIRRPCPIFPTTMRSDELLVRFRDERIHLGVVQEKGKTVGIVTLEDVLEELVGEIEDEKDAQQDAESP